MLKLKTGLRTESFIYDFEIDGGEVNIPIKTGIILPAGTRLTQIHFANIVNFASAGNNATLQVNIGATIITLTATIDIAKLNGSKNVNPEMTFTTAPGELIITPLVESFTAGKGVFYCPYFIAKI